MNYRHPDNPVRASVVTLLQIEREEPGRYLAQLKWDGWRSIMYKDAGQWVRHAKHDTGVQAKTAMPDSLIQELNACGLPDGTGFDIEWMGRREVAHTNGRQWLVVLDLHYWNGDWQGDVTCEGRLQQLKLIFEQHIKQPNIEMIRTSELGLLQTFEASKANPLTEGVVIKARDSKLVGSPASAQDNKHWLKIKWRG